MPVQYASPVTQKFWAKPPSSCCETARKINARNGVACVAGGQKGRRAVDHVPRPNQVIAALILVTFGFSPRNGERRNQSAGVRFVLVREQQTKTALNRLPWSCDDFSQRPAMGRHASHCLL